MGSLDRDFCLQKIDAAADLIERLLDGEHPHDDSRTALVHLRSVYEGDKNLLLGLDETAQSDTVLEYCRRANVNLVRLKKFVGLLLRSTNIRNAFELYFPIRLIASELLGKPAPVVLGSEWEFSPYTYPAALDELPDFIFIGIPASECHNPLILPLAGHELGHVVWRRMGGQTDFDPKIRSCVLQHYKANWEDFAKLFSPVVGHEKLETDLFLQTIWSQSYSIARRQLEELFCDSMGIYLFGQSFLHSFRYLLAPNLGKSRPVGYPRIQSRAKFMYEYACSLQIQKIDGFVDAFNDAEQNFNPSDTFIMKVADQVVAEMRNELPNYVERYKGTAQSFAAAKNEEGDAVACLRALVPPINIKSIAAIVNAAWTVRLGMDDWGILDSEVDPYLRKKGKLRILTDLVLKTFEIYEYTKRTEKHAA